MATVIIPRIKPALGYLASYSVATAGALSFEQPFQADIALLLGCPAALFVFCTVLYLVDLGWTVRALQLLTALVLIFLGVLGDRPANEDVAFYSSVFVVLGMAILTPHIGKEVGEVRNDQRVN